MEKITSQALETLFIRLGEKITQPASFYLLGGSALCLLGSPRETLDVDYSIENVPPDFESIMKQISGELQLDLETVPLLEFIPLPPESESRRRLIGRYGQVDVYIFDLYSIVLSKIARGFESDLEDAQFLLERGLIEWQTLEKFFQSILPRASSSDIDPKEFKAYFEELKRRVK